MPAAGLRVAFWHGSVRFCSRAHIKHDSSRAPGSSHRLCARSWQLRSRGAEDCRDATASREAGMIQAAPVAQKLTCITGCNPFFVYICAMYRLLIKPFVKKKSPADASRIALVYFRIIGLIPGGRLVNRLIRSNRPKGIQREVFGLKFYNPVGLGAGLDKRGELYNDLNDLGFSFIEIGPLGSEEIRIAVENLQKDHQDDILAACINKDHLKTFTLGYDFCDFFVIEIGDSPVADIINPLLEARMANDDYKPIIVKVNEILSPERMSEIVHYCLMNGVDGIEVRSKEQILQVREFGLRHLPIIANCHVNTPQQAAEMLDAGASLVEVRSGLVYEGPQLIGKINRYLENYFKNAKDNNRG